MLHQADEDVLKAGFGWLPFDARPAQRRLDGGAVGAGDVQRGAEGRDLLDAGHARQQPRLLGELGVTSIASLLNWPNLGLLKTDIAAGNRAGVALWLPQLVAAGKITQAEAAAVGGLLAAVEATGPALATTIEGWGLPVTAADLTSDRYGSAGN